MKTLEELKAIRDKAKQEMEVREGNSGKVRVVVGMATCGIASGARPVLNSLAEEVTYVKMTPEKAIEVVDKHLMHGVVLSKYTLSSTAL